MCLQLQGSGVEDTSKTTPQYAQDPAQRAVGQSLHVLAQHCDDTLSDTPDFVCVISFF